MGKMHVVVALSFALASCGPLSKARESTEGSNNHGRLPKKATRDLLDTETCPFKLTSLGLCADLKLVHEKEGMPSKSMDFILAFYPDRSNRVGGDVEFIESKFQVVLKPRICAGCKSAYLAQPTSEFGADSRHPLYKFNEVSINPLRKYEMVLELQDEHGNAVDSASLSMSFDTQNQ